MTDFTISTKLAREFAIECFDVLSREIESAKRKQKDETKEVKTQAAVKTPPKTKSNERKSKK